MILCAHREKHQVKDTSSKINKRQYFTAGEDPSDSDYYRSYYQMIIKRWRKLTLLLIA
jgi:hypothetical protein